MFAFSQDGVENRDKVYSLTTTETLVEFLGFNLNSAITMSVASIFLQLSYVMVFSVVVNRPFALVDHVINFW